MREGEDLVLTIGEEDSLKKSLGIPHQFGDGDSNLSYYKYGTNLKSYHSTIIQTQ